MDIGTLTGHIEFEDTISSDFQVVITKVEQFAHRFDNAFGVVAVGALAVVTAVTSITGAIVAMAKAGDDIDDVAENFNRLAGSAENASAILESMRKGVLDTVNDFKLMTEANRLLQAGVKGNAETFGVVTRGAKILAEEGYGKIETVMSQVNRALETGRAQFLRRIGLNVDVTKAETDLAKSLGTTRDHLNNLGRIEAGRMATLTALNKIVKDAGDIQADFGDRIDSTTASLQNWFHNLNQQITISPHVSAAWDAIKKSLNDAFGGTSQTLMNAALAFVNKFADIIGEYGPKIVHWISEVAESIHEIYEKVREAWDTVPTWLRNVAEASAVAYVGVYGLDQALEHLTGRGLVENVALMAHVSEIWEAVGESAKLATKWAVGYFSAVIGLGWKGFIVLLTDVAAAFYDVAAAEITAFGWLGLIAIGIGTIYEAWKHWETLGPLFDRFLLWAVGYNKQERDNILAAQEHNKILEEQAKKFDDIANSAATAGMLKPSFPTSEAAARFGMLPADVFPASATPPPSPDLTDYAEKLAKATSDLMEKLTQADVQVQAFHAVFKDLSSAQRENLDIQSKLIPIYEKAVDAREHMTAAEAAWYAQAIRNIELEKQRELQSLAFRHITLEMIEARKLSGQTEEQIARQFQVQADSLKNYEDRLEFARREQLDSTAVINMSAAAYATYKDRLDFARKGHLDLLKVLTMSTAEYNSYKDYVELAKQEQLDLNKAVVAGVQPLENYASAQQRAADALEATNKAQKTAADAALGLSQLKLRNDAVVQSLDIQLAHDQAVGASAKRLFADEQALAAAKYRADQEALKFEFENRNKSLDAQNNAVEQYKVQQQQMTADFEAESTKRLQAFLISQNKWFQTIKSIEDRFKALGTNISSNLASTFFGLGDDIDGHLHAAAERAHQAYIQIAADGKHTASELANAWKTWQDAADAASSTLAERIKSVWYDIKKTIIDVLNDILKYFTERFIVGLVKGMAGARLGQNFGAAIGGVGGGGGRGSLLGNLLGIGSTAAPFFGGGGAATAASVFASGGMVAGGTTAGIAAGTGTLAATGPGFGAAAAGGGAGTAAGVGGIGSTLTALASNPITWAAAAGLVLAWGIKSKGWFRGGEEGVKVNPARDKFLAQFAQYQPPGVGDSRNPPGFYGLAALLSQTHNERLFTALTQAHTMKEFQLAEQNIAQSLAGRHIGPDGKEIPRITSLKLFERGGFVQPGDIQPAVLHGGGAGELIGPIHTLARMISAELRAQIVPSVDITTSFDRVVNKLGTKIDEIPSGEEMMTRTGVGGGAPPDSATALGVTRRVGTSGQKVIENNHVWHIEISGGVMDRGNVREIFKEHIIPLHKHANLIDEDGYAESTRRAVY